MVRFALGAAILLAAVLLGLEQLGYGLAEITQDPNDLAEQPWWTGGVSLLGLLAWGAAAAFFASAAFVRRVTGNGVSEVAFLACTGILALLAGVDDALMLHDRALSPGPPRVEAIVLFVYALVAGAWALRFRAHLLKRPGLVFAMGCFAVSVVLDVIYVSELLEEYTKYLGLATFAFASFAELRTAAGMPLESARGDHVPVRAPQNPRSKSPVG
jgi:hypothetical protein